MTRRWHGPRCGGSSAIRVSSQGKVALCALVAALDDEDSDRLLDVQWRTDHLASLGVVSIPRQEYLGRLARALRLGPRLA
ncbi:MAG: hypothetical protein ACKN9D_11010 [Actinomycetales bacterium]